MKSKGMQGTFGPNDTGYINSRIRAAAIQLVSASELWSEGYGYKCDVMPKTHNIAKALKALADEDKKTCMYANVKHDPKLFKPYKPSKERRKQFSNIFE